MAKPRRARNHFRASITSLHEINPCVLQWVMRLLVPLGGCNEFIQMHFYRDEALAAAIGLVDVNDDSEEGGEEEDFSPKQARNDLRRFYRETEKLNGQLPSQLQEGVATVAKLVGLSATDCRILEFAIMLQMDGRLAEACDYMGDVTSTKLYGILAVVLDLPEQAIRESMHSQSMLGRSGLLTMRREGAEYIRRKLDILSSMFADSLYCGEADPIELLRDTVHASHPPRLTMDDYSTIRKPLAVLMPYLQNCLQIRKRGVNILLHGVPGTGKTELARLLAASLASTLYEISSEDSDGDPINSSRRLVAYRAAQYFFSGSRNLLLFDEVEDIFATEEGMFAKPALAKSNKAWINRTLEENTIPTIWISNSINGIDAAFVRRFDMVVEVPLPDKAQRARLIRQYSGDFLPDADVQRFASAEQLAPAVIERAATVVASIQSRLQEVPASEAIEMLLNATLKTQGHRQIASSEQPLLPPLYDPAFIHADVDLAAVADNLAHHPAGRLCLYGPPGTGKTAYGYWLAQTLDKPLLVRRASDLFDMYVGGTEKNIARAFHEADEAKAILMIDEVDSFLQDRRTAHRSWEVTAVNEMLTQMEAFKGIFIASTNLMDGLDSASLRRFDLKVRFDYLTAEQTWQLFCRHCDVLGLPNGEDIIHKPIKQLTQVTPGDFATVIRQSRLRPLKSPGDLLRALQAELSLKNDTLGFGLG